MADEKLGILDLKLDIDNERVVDRNASFEWI